MKQTMSVINIETLTNIIKIHVTLFQGKSQFLN